MMKGVPTLQAFPLLVCLLWIYWWFWKVISRWSTMRRNYASPKLKSQQRLANFYHCFLAWHGIWVWMQTQVNPPKKMIIFWASHYIFTFLKVCVTVIPYLLRFSAGNIKLVNYVSKTNLFLPTDLLKVQIS